MKRWIILLFITLSTLSLGSFAYSNDFSLTNINTDFTTEATSDDLENAKLSRTQVKEILENAQLNLRNYEEQLQMMTIGQSEQNNPQNNKQVLLLKTKIQNQIQLIAVNEKQKNALDKTIVVFTAQLNNEQKKLNNLTAIEKKQRHLEQEQQIQQQINTLSAEQNQWLNEISTLNALIYNKTALLDPSQYSTILEKIFIADENSNITQFKINQLHINNSLSNIFSNIAENLSATELNEQRQMLLLNIHELKQTQEILSKKIDLLKQRANALNQKSDDNKVDMKKQIELFINQYTVLHDNFNQLLIQATAQQEKTATLIAKALAKRQVLPGFDVGKWLALAKNIKQMMLMSNELLRITLHDIYTNLSQTTLTEKIYLYALFFFTATGFYTARYAAKKIRLSITEEDNTFAHQLFTHVLNIFIDKLWLITLIIVSVLFLTILNLSQQLISLVLHLGNTLLIFSIALTIARISLYETISNHKGNDVKLYHRLCWLFSFGFIVRLCMILAEYFNVSYEIQDLFDRTFMLFIFFIALILLKASKVVPELIIPLINPKKTYLIRTIKLLAVVIPLIILSNAVIGLIGYVALAWTISKYEGIFLLVCAGYLILLGLVSDALNFLATHIIRRRSGWIITEAFLKPLSIWLYLALFVVSIYFLLYLYDLSNQAFIVNYFNKILYFPLVTFSTNVLSIWTIIKATIVAIIAYWATKWTREFCYRKLYKNVQDIGVRNSLATFSQYAICVLGIIFILKTLQIDLTTLTVIIGGLAVGVGFSLRDLMNNFISGFMLLIERPMRCGDTVSIGEYEGKITHIGLRATTIIAADNREIIVPNSDAFSKTLINWNRQNDIIRCEIIVKVPRQGEPHELEQVIQAAMEHTTGVVQQPAPYVLLKGISDSLLEFQLYFHFDYRETDSRPIMISRVLFSVWERFAALGIQPPYPTQHIILEQHPEGL